MSLPSWTDEDVRAWFRAINDDGGEHHTISVAHEQLYVKQGDNWTPIATVQPGHRPNYNHHTKSWTWEPI